MFLFLIIFLLDDYFNLHFCFKDQKTFKNANHLIYNDGSARRTTTRRTTTRGTTTEGNDDEGNDDAVSMLLYEENNILLENDDGENDDVSWASLQQRNVAFSIY